MKSMEIERKFLIKHLPEHLEQYPFHLIEQGYLNTNPVVRVRREDDSFYLTYKGRGILAHEEYNLPLDEKSYQHLLQKADGNIISKKRYNIPFHEKYTIELDIFEEPFAPLIIAEVEFESEEEADAFCPPDWFGRDVTYDDAYRNSSLSLRK